MPTSISALDTEATGLADDDLMVADDVSEVETVKVSIATLRAALGGRWPVVEVPGTSATLLKRSQVVRCSGSGPVTLTLPEPENGLWIVVKAGGDTIIELVPHDGVTAIEDSDPGDTYVLGFGANAWAIFSDGTNWFRADHETPLITSARVWTIEEGVSPPSAAAGLAYLYATEVGGRTEPSVRLGDGTVVPLTRVPTDLQSSSFTISDRDQIIEIDDGPLTATLPSPTDGRQIQLVKTTSDQKAITLAPAGSEQIQGVASSYELPGSGDARVGMWTVRCLSGNWWVF
jgi:hypothetical protein